MGNESDSPSDVVLLASLIDPDKVVEWLSEGLRDIVSLDPRVEDIAEKTQARIGNLLIFLLIELLFILRL